MNQDIVRQELLRARWLRSRSPLRLFSTENEDFASGRLDLPIDDLAVRFLALPADPEDCVMNFDPAFWKSFTGKIDGHWGSECAWGSGHEATASGAVWAQQWSTDLNTRYILVHRHGGLEFALGRPGGGEVPHWQARNRGFRLLSITGHVVLALRRHDLVVPEHLRTGEWQFLLALRNTKGAWLHDFARGWADIRDAGFHPKSCRASNLLFVRETPSWPSLEDQSQLAEWFGSAIEESWGSTFRRYVPHSDEESPGFDYQEFRRFW